MDTRKDSKIPNCGIAPVLRGKPMIVGAKQIRKALENNRAKRVFLARNADPAITGPLEALCKLKSVNCTWVPSKEELGNACGIEVGAAAAAAID